MRDREGRLLLLNDFALVVDRAQTYGHRGEKALRKAQKMLFDMYQFLRDKDLPEKDRLEAGKNYYLRCGQYTEAQTVFQNIYRVHIWSLHREANPLKLLDKLFP